MSSNDGTISGETEVLSVPAEFGQREEGDDAVRSQSGHLLEHSPAAPAVSVWQCPRATFPDACGHYPNAYVPPDAHQHSPAFPAERS